MPFKLAPLLEPPPPLIPLRLVKEVEGFRPPADMAVGVWAAKAAVAAAAEAAEAESMLDSCVRANWRRRLHRSTLEKRVCNTYGRIGLTRWSSTPIA
jgi:hypothetical protein